MDIKKKKKCIVTNYSQKLGTYAVIGTNCVEFENVMKSAQKKLIASDVPAFQRLVATLFGGAASG